MGTIVAAVSEVNKLPPSLYFGYVAKQTWLNKAVHHVTSVGWHLVLPSHTFASRGADTVVKVREE